MTEDSTSAIGEEFEITLTGGSIKATGAELELIEIEGSTETEDMVLLFVPPPLFLPGSPTEKGTMPATREDSLSIIFITPV